ncbi:unnamed protein product [Cyprideis torosa]|uniref:Uncharacterized protein n=1 Tax=Cyprideis torosa TaxID=163714 RepID=A0A7R8WHT9_9CRUS|nr:unnamed protein product [Cyprideis torosa]CAG0893362.1 unnamed protein product [Cyprideis torosa]
MSVCRVKEGADRVKEGADRVKEGADRVKEGADRGDSGGPILYDTSVVEDGVRRYKLAGIVSLGVGCGDKRYPGIYTNVWPYLDWITETMALKEKFEV